MTTFKQYFFYATASILLLAVGFVIGWELARQNVAIRKEIVIDTIRVMQPKLSKLPMCKEQITFSFPKLLFVPADTVTKTIVIDKGDSVNVVVSTEQREYRDSTYQAWVSGVVIGDVHPTLDSLNVFQRTIVQSVAPPPKMLRPFATAAVSFQGQSFSVGAGVLIKEKYGMGLEYNRSDNKDFLLLRGVVVF